tara:strand:- start:832 stop:1614 length:783 start_codon:yes stop_codon:yes gene_type:complete
MWTFFAFGVGAGASWFYRADVFAFLLAPAGEMLSPYDGKPVYTNPIGMMGATLHVSMKVGIATAFPVFWVSVLTLLKPWLPRQVWHFIAIFVAVTSACFLVGNAFVYYVMLPVGLGFLLNFGADIAVPMIQISDYLNLLSSLMLWVGVVFELPVAMFLLTKMDVIAYRQFRRFRKFLPAAAYLLAIILTPSFDAITTTMVAVPIVALYEVGLFVSWLANTGDADYLFAGKVVRGFSWALRRPVLAYHKVRSLLMTHGLWW